MIFGAPLRTDWESALKKGSEIIGMTGEALLASLGFEIEAAKGPFSILKSTGTKTAISTHRCCRRYPHPRPFPFHNKVMQNKKMPTYLFANRHVGTSLKGPEDAPFLIPLKA